LAANPLQPPTSCSPMNESGKNPTANKKKLQDLIIKWMETVLPKRCRSR
jgi:hypothetical protein